jgi:DNA-binding CsgD family transcriptional regulator
MARSRRLRLGDVRAVYLLIGECRELGADPVAWRSHLLRGLLRAVDAAVGCSFEIGLPPGGGPDGGWTWPGFRVIEGFPNRGEERAFDRLLREATPARNPFAPVVASRQLPVFTWRRRQVLSDRDWYGNDFVRHYMGQTNLDDLLGSSSFVGAAMGWAIGLNRPRGGRPFTSRERRLFHLCKAEMVRLRGPRLADGGAPSVAGLAPRLRQVLLCLFDGDSQKQAARRLGISAATAHEYVRRLHRLFEASSRGELLARCAAFLAVLHQYRAEIPGPAGDGSRSP